MDERNIHLTKENEKYEEVVRHREVTLRLQDAAQGGTVLADDGRGTDGAGRAPADFPSSRETTSSPSRGRPRTGCISSSAAKPRSIWSLPGGGKRVLRDLSRGSFFGEMGLMTGAPRSATVMAKTDVECYRVDKEMFEEILRARPAIAEEMSQIMALRKAEQNMALKDISEEAAHAGISQQRTEILATIRRFFGLDR